MTVYERIKLLDFYYLQATTLPVVYSGSWRFMLAHRREYRRRWKLYHDLQKSAVGMEKVTHEPPTNREPQKGKAGKLLEKSPKRRKPVARQYRQTAANEAAE